MMSRPVESKASDSQSTFFAPGTRIPANFAPAAFGTVSPDVFTAKMRALSPESLSVQSTPGYFFETAKPEHSRINAVSSRPTQGGRSGSSFGITGETSGASAATPTTFAPDAVTRRRSSSQPAVLN